MCDSMEFFDETKLITYSSLLPDPNDIKKAFLLDGTLFDWAQDSIFAKNMAEKFDLKSGEVINSIFSALVVNAKSKAFKIAVKMAIAEIKTNRRRLIQYNGCRLTSENSQKLKDMLELIFEVSPKDDKEDEISLFPKNQIDKVSIAINVVLLLFKLEDNGEEQ